MSLHYTMPEAQGLQPLLGFFTGYVAILATPGPNLLAIGGTSALCGVHGAAPLCLGLALGAGTLCAAALFVARDAILDMQAWLHLGTAALIVVAAMIALLRPLDSADAPQPASAARGVAAFVAGFLTAGTNPLTLAFFVACAVGPLGAVQDSTVQMLALVGVVALALSFFLGVAVMLAQPLARRTVLAWHRPIRLGVAAVLTLIATDLLGGL